MNSHHCIGQPKLLAHLAITGCYGLIKLQQAYVFGFYCSMAKKAADKCYEDSGLGPQDVDVLEVHDCFSCNELMMYEALGLADDAVL